MIVQTLSKIVIKAWVRFFLYSFIVLFLIISIASLISGFLRSTVTPQEVLASYLLEIPFNIQQILPISCLIASLFSVNKLKSNSELTAIFSTGYSHLRYFKIVFLCAFSVAIINLLTSGFLRPYLNSKKNILLKDREKMFSNLESKGLRASTLASGKVWYKNDQYFLSFKNFDKKTNSLNDVQMYFYNEKSLLKKMILAKSLKYKSDNTWLVENGQVLNNLETRFSYPEVQSFQIKVVELLESLDELTQVQYDITTLNLVELRSYIVNLQESGIDTSEFKINYYEKFSSSLMCIVFALIALQTIFNPNRRSSHFGKNATVIFVITVVYWFVNSYLLELGKNAKLSATAACFTIPAILLLVTGYNFIRQQRLK